MNTDFVDDWWQAHSDKTLNVLTQSENEFKVTYKNEEDKKFKVIFKPKRYPIGFYAKWQ